MGPTMWHAANAHIHYADDGSEKRRAERPTQSGSMQYSPRQSHLNQNYRNWFDHESFEKIHGRGYSNFGYWSRTTSVGQQCDNLVDRLVRFLPVKSGKVLDVGCGQGGTTNRLTRYFPKENITAINLFDDQLDYAKKVAPGCKFLSMDATKMSFDDDFFDVVICVEAAFHFETRLDFLKEALRVLRPSGYLLMTDVLVNRESEQIPAENVVSFDEYNSMIDDVGFVEATLHRVRERTWTAYRRRIPLHLARLGYVREAIQCRFGLAEWDKVIEDYLIVCARKAPNR